MHFCDPEFFICAIDRTVFQSVDIFVVSERREVYFCTLFYPFPGCTAKITKIRPFK